MRPSCLLLVMAGREAFNRKGRKETRKVRKEEELGNPSQTRGRIERYRFGEVCCAGQSCHQA